MATLDWLITEGLSEEAKCKLRSECQDAKMLVGEWVSDSRKNWLETNLTCAMNRQKVSVAKALLGKERMA